jgi:glutamyl-tRNA synthetase
MMTPKHEKKVRVRFAPSPTGPINLGTARTALFNWLFAKHTGGDFIVRIEDTDRERSTKEHDAGILKTLAWLGFDYQELYRQSERIPRYTEHLERLLEEGKAYYCFCSEDELEAERESQLASGFPPRYNGKCRTLALSDARERAKKERAVIRFKIPERAIAFHDVIRGKVSFDGTLFGDIVIAKSLTEPLYNFAVVVDDFEMKITHVIRGEDHISNTPKQIAIYEALGFSELPHFAHLPLILGPDKKKLSKRYLATSVLEYGANGYLPSAILNFLVLLGWHPQNDREILSVEEMIAEFSLERAQKAGAVFNPEKLDWLNAHYIRSLPTQELVERVTNFIPESFLKEPEKLVRALVLSRERLKKLSDAGEGIDFFFTLSDYSAKTLVWKNDGVGKTIETLTSLEKILSAIPEGDFSKEKLSGFLMPFAEKNGRGETLWPLRVALSGKEMSPGPFECAEVLGKKETLARVTLALQKIKKS